MGDDPLSVFAVQEEEAALKEALSPSISITGNSVIEEAEAFLGRGRNGNYGSKGSSDVKSNGIKSEVFESTQSNRAIDNSTAMSKIDSQPSSSSMSILSVPTVQGVETKLGSSLDSDSIIVGGTDLTAEVTSASSASMTSTLEEADEYFLGNKVSLLAGERRLICLRDCYVDVGGGSMISCTLFMTDYRVVLIPSLTDLSNIASKNPSVYSWLQISLMCIERIEKGRKARDTKDPAYVCINIRLVCKDVREYKLAVRERETEVDRALSVMTAFAFPNNLKHIFAFSHALPKGGEYRKVEPYDAVKEFSRQGILQVKNPALREVFTVTKDYDDHPWRISQVNNEYKLCATYPRLLVVPAVCTEQELHEVAHFRSGQRLPALSWGDVETGATLWRASQPKAGVSGSSEYDEKFLDFLAKSCVGMPSAPPPTRRGPGYPLLFIVDCRPRASALANRATGAGYETQTNYPNTRLEFYNIGNIHVMRDSLKSLSNLALSYPAPGSADMNFSKAVEDTSWLSHVRHVIKASYDSADYIRKGVPVLVHCSHGWDRTAQVCSLAQLLLDPFYRTMDGFQVLIEKEWCSFGHQFGVRCAHGQDRQSRRDDEVSPIFLQFLDATWQLTRQHPHYFEFNLKYLLVLADHVHSGRFGTFLFSSDREREVLGADNLPDVWTYLHYNRDIFENPLFLDPSVENAETHPMLFPPLAQILRNVTLWTDYFFRWNFSSGNAIPFPVPSYATYLHQDGWALPQNHLFHKKDKAADFNVPAIATQDSYWEAMYKRVLAEKRELEHKLLLANRQQVEEEASILAVDCEQKDLDGTGNEGASLDAGHQEDIDQYLKSISGAGDSGIFASP